MPLAGSSQTTEWTVTLLTKNSYGATFTSPTTFKIFCFEFEGITDPPTLYTDCASNVVEINQLYWDIAL